MINLKFKIIIWWQKASQSKCLVKFIGQGSRNKFGSPSHSLVSLFTLFYLLTFFCCCCCSTYFLAPILFVQSMVTSLNVFKELHLSSSQFQSWRCGDTVPAEWLKSHGVSGTDLCQTNVSELRQLWYPSRKSCHGKQNQTKNSQTMLGMQSKRTHRLWQQ